MREPRSRGRRGPRPARDSGRIPREPGRTLDPERRLRGLVDSEPPEEPMRVSFAGDLSRKLGPKGRFLAAAVIIGAVITGGSLFWERYTSTTATAADYRNAAQVGLGHTLYDQHCAYCHGVDLAGQAGWDGNFPEGSRPALPLDGSAPIWRLTDRDIFDITKFGGQPFSPPSYRNEMPAYEGRLADADMWAILAYIKSRWPQDVHDRQRETTEAAEG